MNSRRLADIIDKFPAVQLDKTLIFVRRLGALQGLNDGVKPLKSVLLREFVDDELTVRQIKDDVLRVLHAVHQAQSQPRRTASQGVRAAGSPMTKIEYRSGEELITWLSWIPVEQLEEILSQIVSENPHLGTKKPICMSTIGGIWRGDDPKLRYRPKRRRAKYINLLREKGTVSLESFTDTFDVSENHLMRDIRDINRLAASKLELPETLELIVSTANGYAFNTEVISLTFK